MADRNVSRIAATGEYITGRLEYKDPSQHLQFYPYIPATCTTVLLDFFQQRCQRYDGLNHLCNALVDPHGIATLYTFGMSVWAAVPDIAMQVFLSPNHMTSS